ncbi:MAG: nuclear transport factor 2 family protein [Bacteroidota bacterium]
MTENTIQSYLEGLQSGDLETTLALFSENAIIHSPLYGEVLAGNFYKDLFGDTNQSEITLHGVYIGQNPMTASCHFEYRWTLANGEKTTFECIDLFEFDENGKIKMLKIIYDTFQTRKVFDTL